MATGTHLCNKLISCSLPVLLLKDRVVLRGDGAEIIVGNEVTFLDRSTVHVASDLMGSYIGDGSIIGRFSLVHACKIGKSVIIGDQAIVMDGSQIGDNCIITAVIIQLSPI